MAENGVKNPGGKRLASGAPAGGNKGLIALVIAAAVIVGGYTGLCVYARDRFYPHTTVLGEDVSGMAYSEAMSALETRLEQFTKGRTIDLVEPGSGARTTLALDGLFGLAGINSEGFFGEGAGYLAGLLAKENRDATVSDGSALTGKGVRLGIDGAEALDAALDELRRTGHMQGGSTTWRETDTAVIFTKGHTAREIDRARLWREIPPAALAGKSEVEVPVEERAPAEPDFEGIRSQIFQTASTAYYDEEEGKIVPSVTGKDYDVEGAKAQFAATAEGSACVVPLILDRPAITTQELESRLFRDTLGDAVTYVTGTNVRIDNVRHAAELVDGTVVMPGTEFSFNKVCSPYTVDNGYGKATAYVNGLSKDTVAGGICQVSSTLYWASLKGNLETVERYAHAYYPSYIKGGLDATVYGDYGESGSLDFRFKNSTEFPLRVSAYVDNSRYLHVTIQGTDTTGIHGEPYSTNMVVTRVADTIYEPRADVPQGTILKDPERTAYNGTTIDTYQKLVDADGNVLSEEKLYTSKYATRNAVVWYNPEDIWLWNIDPETGIKLPDPEITPDPEVTPGEPQAPADPPVQSQAPEESAAPAEPTAPVMTPPPASTPTPADTEVPVLPPEAPTDPDAAQRVPILTPPVPDAPRA